MSLWVLIPFNIKFTSSVVQNFESLLKNKPSFKPEWWINYSILQLMQELMPKDTIKNDTNT
jgi:hypothetical protein